MHELILRELILCTGSYGITKIHARLFTTSVAKYWHGLPVFDKQSTTTVFLDDTALSTVRSAVVSTHAQKF